MTTTFKYTFYPINAIRPAWLIDKVNIKHDVTTAMTSVGAFPAPIDSAMKYAVPNSAAILSAMKMWSSYVDISFSTTIGTKNIAYGGWNPAGSYGSATTFTENGATGNYAILLNNVTKAGVNLQQAALGNWGGWVHMHELYHVLTGVKDNGISSNDLRNSILTYPTLVNGVIDPTVKIPLTPGMTDIATLQELRAADGQLVYGPSQTSGGNDSYVFTQVTVGTVSTGTVKLGTLGGVINIDPNKAVMTIWDSGGIDTINAAGVNSNVFIDLNAGQFSSIGANKNIAPGGAIGGAFYGIEYNVGIATGVLIENATGGTKADTLVGNSANNTLIGGAGNDSLMGQGGNDNLSGDAGNDRLDGGPSNDTMNGGADNDRLIGSVGSDVYTGGTGADTFVFNFFAFNNITGIDTDRITDFKRTEVDKIDLSAIDANRTNASGSEDAFQFLMNGSLVNGVAGRLVSQAATVAGVAGTMLLADVNGDAAADFNIFLVGIAASTMLASDFIL